MCARKVSRLQNEWNPLGLEALTDYHLTPEIKCCYEKLYKMYEKNFGRASSTQGKQHNKENEEEREPSVA